jgi:hypothetical protein
MTETPSVLRVQIDHADGQWTGDPNSLVMLSFTPSVILAWQPLDRESDISGTLGALVYRDHDGEVALTPDELLRFIRLDLRPAEYLALRAKFGVRWMWHDDFYDDEGNAMQPREA